MLNGDFLRLWALGDELAHAEGPLAARRLHRRPSRRPRASLSARPIGDSAERRPAARSASVEPTSVQVCVAPLPSSRISAVRPKAKRLGLGVDLDHDRVVQPLLQPLDPRLEVGLVLLGDVVLGVLLEVAQLARGLDPRAISRRAGPSSCAISALGPRSPQRVIGSRSARRRHAPSLAETRASALGRRRRRARSRSPATLTSAGAPGREDTPDHSAGGPGEGLAENEAGAVEEGLVDGLQLGLARRVGPSMTRWPSPAARRSACLGRRIGGGGWRYSLVSPSEVC